MKETVKLEQFKELTEKELQEIQGGDRRITSFFCKSFSKKEKIDNILGKRDGFIENTHSYSSYSYSNK